MRGLFEAGLFEPLDCFLRFYSGSVACLLKSAATAHRPNRALGSFADGIFGIAHCIHDLRLAFVRFSSASKQEAANRPFSAASVEQSPA